MSSAGDGLGTTGPPTSMLAAATGETTSDEIEYALKVWSDINLRSAISSWDESYAQVVTAKEAAPSEKQRLVSHVKEFAAEFKAQPTTDKVESLLRFFKAFINGLYERADAAEKAFLSLYLKVSRLQDPTPLLANVHVERAELIKRSATLENRIAQREADMVQLRRLLERSNGQTGPVTASAPSDTDMTAAAYVKAELASMKQSLATADRELRSVSEERNRLLVIVRRHEETIARLENDYQATVNATQQRDEAGGGSSSSGDCRPSGNTDVAASGDNATAAAVEAFLRRQVDRLEQQLRDREAAVEQLEGSMSDANAALAKQRQESTVLQAQLSAAQELAATAPSRASQAHKGAPSHRAVEELTAAVDRLEREVQQERVQVAALRDSLRLRDDQLRQLEEANRVAVASLTAAAAGQQVVHYFGEQLESSGGSASRRGLVASRNGTEPENDDPFSLRPVGGATVLGNLVAPASSATSFLTASDFMSMVGDVHGGGPDEDGAGSKIDYHSAPDPRPLVSSGTSKTEQESTVPMMPASLVSVLEKQRNQLKAELSRVQGRLMEVTVDAERSKRRCQGLLEDKVRLEQALSSALRRCGAGDGGSAVVNVPSASALLGGQDASSSTNRRSRLAAAPRGLLEQLAALLAMILDSRSNGYVRMALVVYLLGLQVFVFGFVFASSSRTSSWSSPTCPNPATQRQKSLAP